MRRRRKLVPLIAAVLLVCGANWASMVEAPLLVGALGALTVFVLIVPTREPILVLAAAALGAAAWAGAGWASIPVVLGAIVGAALASWPLGRGGWGAIAWIGAAVVLVALGLDGRTLSSDERADENSATSPTVFTVPIDPRDLEPNSLRDRLLAVETGTGIERELFIDRVGDGSLVTPEPIVVEREPRRPWPEVLFAVVATVMTALLFIRIRKSRIPDAVEREAPDLEVERLDKIGRRLGHPRRDSETVIAYGRRLSRETDDPAYTQLAEAISADLYTPG